MTRKVALLGYYESCFTDERSFRDINSLRFRYHDVLHVNFSIQTYRKDCITLNDEAKFLRPALHIGILAGGIGSRLFGEGGGSKALYLPPRVLKPLIHYCLSESAVISDREVVSVIIRPDDYLLEQYLREESRGLQVLKTPALGTGPAVAALLGQTINLGAEVAAVLTCDLAGPPGALTSFLQEAHHQVVNHDSSKPFCVVAVTREGAIDSTPIWVRVNEGVVTAYGKSIPAAEYCFGSARVMNAAFASLFLENMKEGMTDTNVMSAALQSQPGCLLAMEAPGLFDVDDPASAERVAALQE